MELDGSSAAPLDIPSPTALERLRFALLRDGPRLPGGRYVGMETAPIAPWPHQAVVARRLIDTWPYSYLLCDEVGLGKTIEAGLAIRSLYLSGLVQRVLICAPASLTRQWQRELADKFLLPCGRALGGTSPRHEYLLPVVDEYATSSLYAPDLVIVSTGLVARKERRQELDTARPFDITLVDEAHYARRKNPTQGSRAQAQYGYLYDVIAQSLRPKSRSLLLATATPMQLDPVEVADLLQLTNRVGAFQYDPSLMLSYYDTLGRLANGQSITTQEWEFLRCAVLAVCDQDPLYWDLIHQAVIDGRIRLAAWQWLEQGRMPRGADVPGLLRLIFAAAPLSRVMLRHTRPLLEIYRDQGQLGANLAQRHILSMPRIVFTDQERQAYDQLETYCTGLAAQMAGRGGRRTQTAVGFLLSFLRLRFASSLFAVRETLGRRLHRVQAAIDSLGLDDVSEPEDIDVEDVLDEGDDDAEAVQALLRHRQPADLQWERRQLQEMLTTLADLSGASSKMTELLTILNRRRLAGTGRLQQTVIFTRFYDTLRDIVERLLRADPDMLIGTYSGHGGQYVEPHTVEMGRPDLEGRLHFATYGDPAFEAILALFDTFELPACIRRLEVEISAVPVKVVGYVVAQRDEDGQPAYRLVTSVHDLTTLRLHEAGHLTDADVEPVRHALAVMAQEEYRTTLMVPRIEGVNKDAGRSQELLAYLVLRDIMLWRQTTGSAESLFWREMAALEEILQGEDNLLYGCRIPSIQARALSGLLFDVNIPPIGEESYVGAARPPSWRRWKPRTV